MMPEAEVSAFLDSNIVLYALSDDDSKRRIANQLLLSEPCISTQVVNECSHVLRRKLLWTPARVAAELEIILSVVKLQNVGIDQIRSAWTLWFQSLRQSDRRHGIGRRLFHALQRRLAKWAVD